MKRFIGFIKKKKWLLLIPLIFVTACSTSGPFQKNLIPPEDKGVIVGSIARHFYLPSSYTFKNLETEKTVYFRDKGPGKLVSAPNDYDIGVLFAIPAKPGNYVFSRYGLHDFDGVFYSTYRNAIDMNLPFTVKAGQVTYIGEFTPTRISGKSPLGFPITVGGKLEVDDNRKHDIPLLREKHPSLNWKNVRYDIVNIP